MIDHDDHSLQNPVDHVSCAAASSICSRLVSVPPELQLHAIGDMLTTVKHYRQEATVQLHAAATSTHEDASVGGPHRNRVCVC